MRAPLLLVLLALLGQCATRERADDAPPSALDQFEERRADCVKRGGNFSPTGSGSEIYICFLTPRDAGRACSSNRDCEGVCLARSRTCAPVVPLLGCNEVLLDGGSVAVQCVE